MSSEIVNTLGDYLDQVIMIKLRNKKTVRGNLQDFDQQMNIILTDSKDITTENVKNLNNILIRGANIIMVSLPDTQNQKDDGSV